MTPLVAHSVSRALQSALCTVKSACDSDRASSIVGRYALLVTTSVAGRQGQSSNRAACRGGVSSEEVARYLLECDAIGSAIACGECGVSTSRVTTLCGCDCASPAEASGIESCRTSKGNVRRPRT